MDLLVERIANPEVPHRGALLQPAISLRSSTGPDTGSSLVKSVRLTYGGSVSTVSVGSATVAGCLGAVRGQWR